MPDPRRLPDSNEVKDRRMNDRLMRWTALLFGLMVAGLVGLLVLRWILPE